MSSRTAAMRLLWQTGLCADLACSRRVRTDIPPWLRERDPIEVVAERAAELREPTTTCCPASRWTWAPATRGRRSASR
jgi:hypothetical protein